MIVCIGADIIQCYGNMIIWLLRNKHSMSQRSTTLASTLPMLKHHTVVMLSLCCGFLFMTLHACFVCAAEPADPTAGMSAREKKMYELQQRLRQSRKANENAVIAEKRRQQVSFHELLCTCLSTDMVSTGKPYWYSSSCLKPLLSRMLMITHCT